MVYIFKILKIDKKMFNKKCQNIKPLNGWNKWNEKINGLAREKYLKWNIKFITPSNFYIYILHDK